MKVIFSDAAEASFEIIGDYIARDNPSRAISFVIELREACAGLAEFPSRFPLAEGYENLGVRRRIYGNYLIFYVVAENGVTILQVSHAAQNS